MSEKKRLIRSDLLGSLCGVLVCVVLMCIFAAVLLSAGLPGAQLTDYAMLAIAACGALTGGFLAAKFNKGAGLVAGACTAAVMFLLMTAAGVVRGESVSTLSALRFAALMAGGIPGGILGIREKKVV